jgi:hypothetical protein
MPRILKKRRREGSFPFLQMFDKLFEIEGMKRRLNSFLEAWDVQAVRRRNTSGFLFRLATFST